MTQEQNGLVEALQFYASPRNWTSGRWVKGHEEDDDADDTVENLICVDWQIEDGGVAIPFADCGDRARKALAALQAPQEAWVAVKALNWRDHRGQTFPDTWTAQTPCGVYEIEERSASDSPAYVATGPLHVFLADKDSLEAAKAAAQADFDARIRSALSQPVAQHEPSEDEPEKCPICAEPFKTGDICADDITEGMCHAACLEGSAIVDLETGEPSEGPVTTYPYPAPSQDAAVEKLVEIAREHLEIDGDGEGPFIRFDSIENAVRAVLAATRPAEAQTVAVAEGIDQLWCETCGEANQEVHTEYAGLCQSCWEEQGKPT